MKKNKKTSSSKRGSIGFVSRFLPSKGSPHIVDDIRGDSGIMFADDVLDQSTAITLPHSDAESKLMGSCRQEPPSHSQTSAGAPAIRRNSQHAIVDLQREVDMALEFFSQEAARSSDDISMACESQYIPINKDSGVRFSNSDCDDSYPSTAATSLSPSDDYDTETDNGQSQSILSLPPTSKGGLSLKHKTKSLVSLPLSLLPSQTALNCAEEEESATAGTNFDTVICKELQSLGITPEEHVDRSFAVDFDSNHSLRNAMEPYLCVARLKRDVARQTVFDTLQQVMLPQEDGVGKRSSCHEASSFHIGSSYGVPYPALRNENRFLYDLETFPLDKILAETLGVSDLSKLHLNRPRNEDKREMMSPLRNRGSRRRFHQLFDSFVVSHVIPLLHSQALSKGIFYTNRHQLQRGKPQTIVYRYQAFPSINIVRPGESSTDPHCDMTQGHSIGNISFHVPLTASYSTNAVYVESRPGREDWHPLSTSSPGLGFQFDGARCLHFNLKNETDITRVSLNFRIAITRACDVTEFDPDDQLCCPELLNDTFSKENPGFYDEVEVSMGDIQRSFLPRPIAVKRKRCSVSIIG